MYTVVCIYVRDFPFFSPLLAAAVDDGDNFHIQSLQSVKVQQDEGCRLNTTVAQAFKERGR